MNLVVLLIGAVVGALMSGCDELFRTCGAVHGIGGIVRDTYIMIDFNLGVISYNGRVFCDQTHTRWGRWLDFELDAFECPEHDPYYFSTIKRQISHACVRDTSIKQIIGTEPHVLDQLRVTIAADGSIELPMSPVEDLRDVDGKKFVVHANRLPPQELMHATDIVVIEPVSSVLKRAAGGDSFDLDDGAELKLVRSIHAGRTVYIYSKGPLSYLTTAMPISKNVETVAIDVTDEEECCICYEKLAAEEATTEEKSFSILGCGHRFHTDCIEKWEKTIATCPMCRSPSQ